MREYKKRYKMYKSGKHWVTKPLLFVGSVAISVGIASFSVSADNVSQANVQDSKIESVQNKSQADSSVITESNSENASNSQQEKDEKQEAKISEDSKAENESAANPSQSVEKVSNDNHQQTSEGNIQIDANDDSENKERVLKTDNRSENADSTNSQIQEQAENKNNQETESKTSGFQKDDDGSVFYYDEKGDQVHGQKNIDGNWYFFDENTGIMQTGFKDIKSQNKTVYYASNGQMQYGQQRISNHWYLFDDVTGAMKTGLQYIKSQNKLALYASNGQMQYGMQKVGGKNYSFNRTTGALQANGQKNINGHWYLFDNKGRVLSGFQRIGNQHKTVYYDVNTARMQYGQKRINGSWYLFDNVTGAMRTGLQRITNQNKTVYYDNSGKMQYGQKRINGSWYLFDSVTGAMKTGFQRIANQNKTVYYDNSGKMQYGQKRINGSWYLFDNVTGAMKTGFQRIANQNKTVYYDNSGKMQYGQKHINGSWYLFDNVTGAMKTGFQRIANQNKTVYYDNSGKMQYGQKHINGSWYLFDNVTGAMKTGLQFIEGQKKLVFYGSDGKMKYGVQRIGNKKFSFNRTTGALEATGQQNINRHWYLFDNKKQIQTGFQKISNQNKTVYYDQKTAQMQYGQKRISDNWYMFDSVTGAMKIGFQRISNQNKTVYYNQNGQMQYDWKMINGKKYYFDRVTGKMATGNVVIDSNEYLFDNNGVLVRAYAEDNDNYREKVAKKAANEIKNSYGVSVDYDWNNQNDDYHAFTMSDTAQLIAMGQLKNDAATIETNLKNNALMKGGVLKTFVNVVKSDYSDKLQDRNVSAFINSLKGVQNINDSILGVGSYRKDGNITTVCLLFSEHVPSHVAQGSEKTSSVEIKVTDAYKNAGVNVDVDNGIKKGDVLNISNFGSAFSKVDSKSLTGKSGETISEDVLKLIFASLPGNTSALEGTRNYYHGSDTYHYQFWLQGQNSDQKQYNFLNANKGIKYGDKIVLPYSVTLVWGKSVGQNADDNENNAPKKGKPTSQMTAQEVEDAYKNGTETGLRFEQVKVKKVDGMTDEMIRGVDIGSYLALKNAGVKFYDYDGNEAPLLKVLKDSGVNWIRARIWNNPYDAENHSYGAGIDDEYTTLELAKEAKKYGINLMLDFHYSDFWADPAKQLLPKAWTSLSSGRIEHSVYNYTRKVLSDFKKNGIDVGMVQLGNEITDGVLGIISERGKWWQTWNNQEKAKNICRYLEAGSKAVRQTYDNAAIALHVETPDVAKYRTIMTRFKENNVDYDVLGTSYYPFWSSKNADRIGTNSPTMLERVQKVAKDEFGKRTVVLETGWVNSLYDSDGTGNNLSWADKNLYSIGPQGQVDESYDMYKALVAGGGLGAFYWEPAWVPVKAGWTNWDYNKKASDQYGTGWCSKYAADYTPDAYWNGKPTWGGTTWDNVTLFDPNGHPLQSLMMYKGFLEGYESPDMTSHLADTSVSYKIDKIWNSNNYQVDNALSEGTVLSQSDVLSTLSDAAKQLLNGEQGEKISESTLKKVVKNLGGVNTGIMTKSFFDKDGNEYQYELWLEGQAESDKEWNVLNDNKDVKYGDNLVVRVNATLKMVKSASV
ncbi:glycosyl hydrolase 53 family protein [Ligilactobacillus ruminis]|uniref:glycosyl hydrolase 53 family protein n=1 Tax=Ligilactobacillus ruminis TaxID=1623 RepID=UPI00265A78CC|nr:glycosyl hydrolase 53 family protein [Ligilactobacillus ruminis]WKB70603.1 glycosyl hydrolase 53 family protein [Ligilactobacillus ruminis]